MSDDIVERLRTFDIYDYADADKICREAAARIGYQAARIETLEAALKEIRFMTTEADGAARAEALIDELLAGGEDE